MITPTTIKAFEALETPFYYYDMELLEQTLKQDTNHINKYGYTEHYAL